MLVEMLKKTAFAGLGIAAYSRERAKRAIHTLASHGEKAYLERRRTIELLLAKGRMEARRAAAGASLRMERCLALAPVATRSELLRLEGRVADLERRSTMEAPIQGAGPAVS